MIGARLSCVVIGCKRTAAAERFPNATAILCGKCFRLAPRHLRRRIRRIEKTMRRLGIMDAPFGSTSPGSLERRLLILHSRIFDRIRDKAFEARVGIA